MRSDCGADAVDQQRFFQRLPHGLTAAHRPQRVLKNELHGAGKALAVLRLPVGAVTPVDPDAALGGGLQPDDGARKRGLAAAGLADDAVERALGMVRVHAIDSADQSCTGLEMNFQASRLDCKISHGWQSLRRR